MCEIGARAETPVQVITRDGRDTSIQTLAHDGASWKRWRGICRPHNSTEYMCFSGLHKQRESALCVCVECM